MTKTEIKNKINEIEKQLFNLKMIDRWGREEYNIHADLMRKLQTLKELDK